MKTALVLMAAGLGSRYGGNKQVDGVGPNNEMLMEYAVYDGIKAGFDKIVFVVKPDVLGLVKTLCGEKAKQMKTAAGEPVEVEYVFQDGSTIPAWFDMPAERTKPLGTVHAALAADTVVNEPFAIINSDDYYGGEALKIIHDALVELAPCGEGLMVAYHLENTVSRNGSVNRGICRTENGFLKSVTETYKIAIFPDETIRDTNTLPEGVVLDPKSRVSMNMWGFADSVFTDMKEYFADFLKNLNGDLKKECILPGMVDEFIQNGKLKVKVLETDSEWFGVTYKEDRAAVTQALKALHNDGIYPDKLWE